MSVFAIYLKDMKMSNSFIFFPWLFENKIFSLAFWEQKKNEKRQKNIQQCGLFVESATLLQE